MVVSTHAPDPDLKSHGWIHWSFRTIETKHEDCSIQLSYNQWLYKINNIVFQFNVSDHEPGENKESGAHKFIS